MRTRTASAVDSRSWRERAASSIEPTTASSRSAASTIARSGSCWVGSEAARASSASARMTVSGVRNSWATSSERRRSACSASAIRSSMWSRIWPSSVISSTGGPRAKRRSRSCSSHSWALRTMWWTCPRVRRAASRAATPAATTVSRPRASESHSPRLSACSYGVRSTPATTTAIRRPPCSTGWATSRTRSASTCEPPVGWAPEAGDHGRCPPGGAGPRPAGRARRRPTRRGRGSGTAASRTVTRPASRRTVPATASARARATSVESAVLTPARGRPAPPR